MGRGCRKQTDPDLRRYGGHYDLRSLIQHIANITFDYFHHLMHMFSLMIGEYLQLSGKWIVASPSSTKHSNLPNAKRSCLKRKDCFGVKHAPYGLGTFSVYFPVLYEESDPNKGFRLYKKDTLSGTFI